MANRKSSRRGGSTRVTRQTTARHVWLAALGAASTARRHAFETLASVAGQAMQLREQVVALSGDARDIARGAAMTVEERIEPLLRSAVSGAEAALAPLRRRPGAKQAARKTSKRAGKKAAARRGSGARRQAAKRVAGKGRG